MPNNAALFDIDMYFPQPVAEWFIILVFYFHASKDLLNTYYKSEIAARKNNELKFHLCTSLESRWMGKQVVVTQCNKCWYQHISCNGNNILVSRKVRQGFYSVRSQNCGYFAGWDSNQGGHEEFAGHWSCSVSCSRCWLRKCAYFVKIYPIVHLRLLHFSVYTDTHTQTHTYIYLTIQ